MMRSVWLTWLLAALGLQSLHLADSATAGGKAQASKGSLDDILKKSKIDTSNLGSSLDAILKKNNIDTSNLDKSLDDILKKTKIDTSNLDKSLDDILKQSKIDTSNLDKSLDDILKQSKKDTSNLDSSLDDIMNNFKKITQNLGGGCGALNCAGSLDDFMNNMKKNAPTLGDILSKSGCGSPICAGLKNNSYSVDSLNDLLKSSRNGKKDPAYTTDILNMIWSGLFGTGGFQAGGPCSVCGKSSLEYTSLKTESVLNIKGCQLCNWREESKTKVMDAVIKQSENGSVTKDIEDAIGELLNVNDDDLPREKKRSILETLLGIDPKLSVDFNFGINFDGNADWLKLQFNKIKGSGLQDASKKSIYDLLNIRIGFDGNLNLGLNLTLSQFSWKKCTDYDLHSSDAKYISQKIGCGCQKVTITMNRQESQSKCEFGKNFGNDGGRVFVSGECSGNFRVCEDLDDKKQLEQLNTGSQKCSGVFKEAAGHCIFTEAYNKRNYFDAFAACAEKGGRLLQVADAANFFGSLSALPFLKGQSLHYGGFTDFKSVTEGFLANLASKFRISESEARDNCGCFGGDRKSYKSRFNSPSAIASKCPLFDFGSNSNTLGSCSDKRGYICEEISKSNQEDAEWSQWFNIDKDMSNGNIERLTDVIDAAHKGELGNDIRLCINPIETKCRAVGTTYLYSSKNTGGLILDKACEKSAIICYNEKQGGKKCPDFEISFRCPLIDLDDCSLDPVRKNCEIQGKSCANTVFATICITNKPAGNLECDIPRAIVNGVSHELLTCSLTGGNLLTGFDKTKADILTQGDRDLISTCNNFTPNEDFPVISIKVTIAKANPSTASSRVESFSIFINGTNYAFSNNLFTRNGIRISTIDFDDGTVKITYFLTGGSRQIDVVTLFGFTFRWNSESGVSATVPDYYKGYTCGLCGNYNGDINAGVNEANGPAAQLSEGIKPIQPEGNQTVLSDPKLCGILRPDGPLGQFLLGLLPDTTKDIIKTLFSDHLTECSKTLWQAPKDINRCERINYFVKKSIECLNMDKSQFVEINRLWRTQSGCGSTTCGLNQVYNPLLAPGCQKSLANPFADITCEDYSFKGGCECVRGYLLSDNLACVAEKEAETTCSIQLTPGKPLTIKNGDTVVIQPCKKTATCVNGSVVENDLEICSDNAECSPNGNDCVCLPGFKGNGHTCFLDNKCRKGFMGFGTKCYSVIHYEVTFEKAGEICGTMGAKLAGFDDETDLLLEPFIKQIETPEAREAAKAKTVPVNCPFGGTCNMVLGHKFLGCRSRNQNKACDKPFEISEDRWSLKAGSCGDGNFLCDVVDEISSAASKIFRNYWIRGNTYILPVGTQVGKCSCNLQPPKLLDYAGLNNTMGCYQAGLNKEGKMIVAPNTDCEEKAPAICEDVSTDKDTSDVNECNELEKKNIIPCLGGQICVPTENGYWCKCPDNYVFNKDSKKCEPYSKSCSLGLGTTITTFTGTELSFTSNCGYKLLGTLESFINFGPSFAIYSHHKPCLDGKEKCVFKISIVLKNIKRDRCSCKGTQDFRIEVELAAKNYLINGVAYTKSIAETDSINIEFRTGSFSIGISPFGLSVTVNNELVNINVPESTRSSKMDGLCSGSSNEGFKVGGISQLDINAWLIKLTNKFAIIDKELPKCDDAKPVDPVVPKDCANDDAKWSKSDYCGIFNFTNSTFNACFVQTGLDQNYYFNKCRIEACRSKKPQEAVCNVGNLVGQHCAEKNYVLQWRTPNLCQYSCNEGVYTTDASNQPVCGVNPVFTRNVQHRRFEGCGCSDGKKWLNGKCVPDNECCCSTGLLDDVLLTALAVNESLLRTGCREKVTCQKNDDGTNRLEHTYPNLPANSHCSTNPPFTTICDQGFEWNEKQQRCLAKIGECERGFVRKLDICVTLPSTPLLWGDAVDICAGKGATFIDLSQPGYKDLIKEILQETKFAFIFITGRVKVNEIYPKVSFKTCLTDKENEDTSWFNLKFHGSFLDDLKLHNTVSPNTLTVGSLLNIVASVYGSEVQFWAVQPNYKGGLACVPRNSSENDLVYLDNCNIDNGIEDGGDIASTFERPLSTACRRCPWTRGVKCEQKPSSQSDGTLVGSCSLTNNRAGYTCTAGKLCYSVSVLCDKDADECANGYHTCDQNSECVNTIGNYKCVCKQDYSIKVNGQCSKAQTCSMTTDKNDYIYNIVGFRGIPGLLNLNCKFRLFSTHCKDISENIAGPSASEQYNIPFASIYVLRSSSVGFGRVTVNIYLSNPETNTELHLEISQANLLNGYILAGTIASDLKLASVVGYKDAGVGVEISSSQVGFISITEINNYYSCDISMIGNFVSIKVTLSEHYNKLCGVCDAKPVMPGSVIEFSETEIDEISVEQYAKCKNPVSDLPLTSPVPNTTPYSKTPFTDESTVSQIDSVTTSTVPIISPPVPDETCDISFESFCASLSLLFSNSEASCHGHVCGGKISKCDYLSLQTFKQQANGPEQEALTARYCPDFCGPNQEFRLTQRSAQPTCANPQRRNTVIENSEEDYTFACVCHEGYLFTGTECVPESQCGCNWNGQYQEIDSEWRSDQCNNVHKCRGNNKVDSREAPCGKNTYCTNTERGPTCQCHENYYGNPECNEGCEEGLVEDNGSKICYNYSSCNGMSEIRCDCRDGFISNCDDCEDIDECKEGFHECNLTTHDCVNKRGGYSCECHSGYTEKQGKCVDIDECSRETHNCSQNQGCINKEGSFKCKCCAGFKEGSDPNTCERDLDFPVQLPYLHCCHTCSNEQMCNEADLTPHCYKKTDNGQKKDYKNYFTIYQELCVKGLGVDSSRLQKGKCLDIEATSVKPERPTQPQKPPTPKGCEDSNLCDSFPAPPSLAKGQVCGPESSSEPKTYPSHCDLMRAMCTLHGFDKLSQIGGGIKAKPGSCDISTPKPPVKDAEPIFTPWGDYSPCIFFKEHCGQGVQFRARSVIPYEDGRVVRAIADTETNQSRTCFELCPDTPDNPDNSSNKCPDPSFCNDIDPVCGTFGIGAAQQFTSPCHLIVAACNEGAKPQLLYKGLCDPDDDGHNGRTCDKGPKHLSVKYDLEQDGKHCVGDSVNIGTCGDLLCEGGEHTCCRATEYEKTQITVVCVNLSTGESQSSLTHVYLSATKCECQRKLVQ